MSHEQNSEVHLNLGQGASHQSQTIPSNVLQGGESVLQPATSFGHGSGCPQHPNHFHHHGAHPQDMSTVQMNMPANPIGTQCNTALTQQQQRTVIFAAAPPGHQMSMPVIGGFPPAPNMLSLIHI